MRCPAVQASSHRRHGCLAPQVPPAARNAAWRGGSRPALLPKPTATSPSRALHIPDPFRIPRCPPQVPPYISPPPAHRQLARPLRSRCAARSPGECALRRRCRIGPLSSGIFRPSRAWLSRVIRALRRLHRVTTLPCRRVKLRASLQRPLCTVTLPAPGLRQIPAEHPGAVRGSVPRPCGGCLRSQNPFKGSAPPRHGERAHRKRSGGSRERSFVVIKILPPRRDRICAEAIPQGAGLTRRAAAPGEGWPFPRGSALIYVRTAARRGRPRTAETATSHGEAAGPGAPTRDRADGGDVPGLASHATDTCRCSARSRAALSPHGERRVRPGCLRAPLPGVPALVHPPG
ncbi:uncharacterized protein LOC133272397 [Pezoporus flaviventris]|uniref:uncharacterized protein LOC133272397 n=1 Tax=Pezoporus flaviventris TaxID=889875 RepID=UPI002AB2682B|nr:uncharacterized protein LOC133272397 [Pezoporus flaviventris]